MSEEGDGREGGALPMAVEGGSKKSSLGLAADAGIGGRAPTQLATETDFSKI